MGNKQLAKILVCSGGGLLAALIVTRIFTIQKTDQLVEVRKIDGVQLEDTKIPGKEKKTTLLDNMKREEDKKKMGLDNMEYVQLDFKKLAAPKQNAVGGDVPELKPVNIKQPARPAKRSFELQTLPANLSPTQPILAYQAEPEQTSIAPLRKRIQLMPAASVYPTQETQHAQQTQPDQPTQQLQPSESNNQAANPFGTIKNADSNIQRPNTSLKEYYAAQVYGDQKLMTNTALVVRNMEEMSFNELVLPKNSFFYGVVSFSGNRVIININKVKTSAGEFPVKYSIMDNDRIEGLYYQAPIDEVVASTADNSNLNNNVSSNAAYGSFINTISKGAVTSAKQLLQKARSLTLQEGYSLFLMPVKKQ